ncbi:hypothetical protein ACFQ5M_08255 [Agrilactobacillus yilanensis]|uniref:PH domain-containing protein n=1 Tax=Agrilactobacillus yilanensis TaxID=2485997 RepID=A0ABW4JA42_9LACO|nr:hypothetical protein [Agrilactobacillus yilanensis]
MRTTAIKDSILLSALLAITLVGVTLTDLFQSDFSLRSIIMVNFYAIILILGIYSNYRLKYFNLCLNAYIAQHHLSRLTLEEVTGFSRFDFSINRDKTMTFAFGLPNKRRTVLKKLKATYGPLATTNP